MHKTSRRTFLKAAAAAACLPSAPLLAADAQPKFIDAHTHFYDPSRKQGVPWPPKNDKRLYRTVLPADLRKQAGPQLAGTVVIEASKWVEDNGWILELAANEPLIVGFVGHLTPGDPEFAEQLARYGKNPLFRGIRIQVGQVREGLASQKFLDDIKRLADRDLELDVNGGPDTPKQVALLAEKLPELRIVINHVGNLRIDGGAPNIDWVAGMLGAGGFPNVYCKVSALVEGTGHHDGQAPADLSFYRPVLDKLCEAFDEDHLIYGSNWPVSDRAAPYATVIGIVREYFTAKGPAVAEKFFYTNSQAAYKWIKR